MSALPTLCLSVAPRPPVEALPNLLARLSAEFTLPENESYLRALVGESSAARPMPVVCERVGALSPLPSLLRLMGKEPAELSLGRDEQDRPYLADPTGIRPVDFNLSHAREHVACACVASPFRVGVDIEEPLPIARAEKLTERYATAGERSMLTRGVCPRGTLLSPLREGFVFDFTCLWTIREAISKYMGTGQPMRFDASTPPAGVRLLVAHLPESGTRLSLCVSGDVCTPIRWGDDSLSPVVDLDLCIP